MDVRDWPPTLDRAIGAVATAKDPYEAAVSVSGVAGEHLVTSVVASRLYQIWRELEDRWELKPDERAEALALMRRAATEWLAVKDHATPRSSYLDHWQYEVCGYKR